MEQQQNMNKIIRLVVLSLLLLPVTLFSQITLTHNVGNTLVPNSMYSCSWGGICWARKFTLSDFGINARQNFTITSGEVGLFAGINWDTNLQFNIYAVDSNFPASFTDNSLIGSSQVVPIPVEANNDQIVSVSFTNPVIVPAGTSTILVEVFQLHSLSSEAHASVAATADDNDFSWFRSKNAGCAPASYTTTVDLGRPDGRFYITVNGTASDLAIPTVIADEEIVLFPNPINDEFSIQNIDINSKIELFNALGQPIAFIKSIKSSNEVTIKPSTINTGLYYLKIGDRIIKKIVMK